MKRSILSLLLTLTFLASFAQVADVNRQTKTPLTGSNAGNQAVRDYNLTAIKNLRIPLGPTFSIAGAKDSLGYVMFNTSIGKMGIYRGNNTWDTLSTTASSAPQPDGILTIGTMSFNSATYVATVTSPFVYRLNNVNHTLTNGMNITLDPRDPTYPRIDLIYATTSGTLGKVTGVAGVDYQAPDLPPNTILIAQVNRRFGSPPADYLIVNTGSGYVAKVGDFMTGSLTLRNGVDFVTQSVLGLQDAGDWVMRGGSGEELIRLHNYNDADTSRPRLQIRFYGDDARDYEMLHTGNIVNRIIDNDSTVTGKTWSSSKISGLIDTIDNRIYYNYTSKYPLSIKVWRDSIADTVYHTNYNWSTVKEGIPSTPLYIANSGTDGLGRGTISLPLKSLKYALDNYNGQDFRLKSGDFFNFSDGFQDTEITRNLKISTYGGSAQARVTVHNNNFTWILDGSSGGTTWTHAQVATIRNVIDTLNVDEFGQFKPLYIATSLANCYATAGTYFQTGAVLYVHTFNGRQPDNAIFSAEGTQAFRSSLSTVGVSPKNFYFENIEFWGGINIISMYNDDATALKTLVAKNCDFYYSSGDGVAIKGYTHTFFNTPRIAYSFDNLDYTAGATLTTYSPVSLEYNAFSSYATNRINSPTVGDANNASTAHADSKVLRVKGTYTKAEGRVIADIDRTISVNIGVKATNSISNTTSGNVGATLSKTGFGMGEVSNVVTAASQVGFYQMFDTFTSGNDRSYQIGVNDVLDIRNHFQSELVRNNLDNNAKRYVQSQIGSTSSKIIKTSNPDGGLFKEGISSTTGAIRIKSPTVGGNSVMYLIKGTIYNYSNNQSSNFTITLYPNNMTTQNTAYFVGTNGGYAVRWYTNGSDRYIYIGELASTWNFLGVTIDDVIASHTDASNYNTIAGWEISLSTSFDGTQNASLSAGATLPYSNLNQPITGYVVGSNSVLSASDTHLQAYGKIQGQISANAAAIASSVTSITGTTNQITVAGTTTPTLSIPNSFTLPNASPQFTAVIGGTTRAGRLQDYPTSGGGYFGLFSNTITPSATNYTVLGNGVFSEINATTGGSVKQSFNGTAVTVTTATGMAVTGTLSSTGSLSASIAALGTAGTTFLTHTAGLIQSRTAAQVRSDIGAGTGNGTLTSITPGYGFTSATPITATGTLTIDTAGATGIVSKPRLTSYLALYARLSSNNTFSGVNNFTSNVNFSLTPASLGGNGYRFWNTGNTFSGVISAPTLTSNRTYDLPDASGTIALTSNLTGKANLSGGNSFTGTQYFTSGTNGTSINENKVEVYDFVGNATGLNSDRAYWSNSGYYNNLKTSTLTADRNILLPNESGVIALGTIKTLTASGTGAATTISIAHGLSGITTSSAIIVMPNNAASAGVIYATVDATNINIVYTVAPASGTNNLLYSVTIK